jgi:protein TonB
MKRKKNMLSLMLCVSVALHGALFFLAPVYSANNPLLSEPDRSPDPFALVNLALIEPAPPEPLPPPPVAPSLPPPPALSEAVPDDTGPAENFIPVEELIPVNLGPPPSTETPVSGVAASAAGPSSADAAGQAALSAAYVKRNYDYIQRRIRDKLVYPLPARRTGIQGTAEISFTIHEDGQVSDVTITRSSGSELLDTAAAEAIQSASPFRPPPAEARLAIPVAFRLK